MCARRLTGLPTLFVGVRCPLPEILARRAATPADSPTRYATATPDSRIPPPVLAWEAVHDPGIYDLEVDTSRLSPEACAKRIIEMRRA